MSDGTNDESTVVRIDVPTTRGLLTSERNGRVGVSDQNPQLDGLELGVLDRHVPSDFLRTIAMDELPPLRTDLSVVAGPVFTQANVNDDTVIYVPLASLESRDEARGLRVFAFESDHDFWVPVTTGGATLTRVDGTEYATLEVLSLSRPSVVGVFRRPGNSIGDR